MVNDEMFSRAQNVTGDSAYSRQTIEEDGHRDTNTDISSTTLNHYSSSAGESSIQSSRKTHFRYRTRLEIASVMLKEAQSGALKSKIQFSAYISSQQLKKYLELLSADGLIEHNKDNGHYYTTNKGRELIHFCDEVADVFHPNLGNR